MRQPVERVELDYISCAGDTAHFFGLVAFIFFCVAVATPAWIDNEIEYPGRTEPIVFGRGLWQAYEYDNNGLWTLFNYFTEDADGKVQDPFCGDDDAMLASPFLNSIDVTRGRSNDSKKWCEKRQVLAAFALMALFFTAMCFMISLCLQRGCCSVWIYMVSAAIAVASSIIALSIGAIYVQEQQDYIDKQAVENRLFPVEQQTMKIGYSLSLFICGFILMLVAFLLFLCECIRSGSNDIEEAEE